MRSRLSSLQLSDDWTFARPEDEYVIGLDEVGTGCLAGPVVAACFAFSRDVSVQIPKSILVTDSKKLKESQLLESESWLRGEAHLAGARFAVGEASVPEIDELNILHAAGLAMSRALAKTLKALIAATPGKSSPRRATLLVDGSRIPRPFQKYADPQGAIRVVPMVKGDAKSFAIAAASILAKTSRDRFMTELSQTHACYGWQNNVGYPTPEHKAAVKKHGPTDWHRRSFHLEF